MMTYTRSAIGLLTRQYRSVLKKCFLINCGLFALGAVSVADANAETYNVATLAQLQSALLNVVDGDTINITANITLTSSLGNLAKQITINNNEHTLNGNNKSGFNLVEGSSLTIDGGTWYKLKNATQEVVYESYGYAYGGAIYNSVVNSQMTITDATFSNNVAYATVGSDSKNYGYGGAIYNKGNDMNISSSYFTSNNADLVTSAIYNTGTGMTISSSNFASNTAKGYMPVYYWGDIDIYGGTIYNTGADMNISNSSFNSNKMNSTFVPSSTYLYGGVIYNAGANAIIINSNFTSNSANTMLYGGAIYNAGAGTTITGSTFTSNSSTTSSYRGYGGAIYNTGSNVSISSSTFTSNSIQNSSGKGGAIYNTGTNMTITDSTFSDNKIGNSPNDIYNSKSITFAGTNTLDGGIQSYDTATLTVAEASTLNYNIGQGKVQSDSLGIFTNNGTTNLTIDLNLGSNSGDTITTRGASSGVITITGINYLGGQTWAHKADNYSFRVLRNDSGNNNLQLALSDALKTPTVISTIGPSTDVEDVTENTAWSKVYNKTITDTIRIYGTLTVKTTSTTNDSIGIIKTQEGGEISVVSQGDTLKLINQSNLATRDFNATADGEIYVVSDSAGLGKAAAGTININGKPDGASANGTIDLNGKTGFELDKATTLNINNTDISNASGNVIDISSGDAEVNLTGSNITGSVANAGTINLDNSTISGNITGSGANQGTINVKSAWEMTGTATNQNINVEDGAILTAGAGNLVSSDNLNVKSGAEVDVGSNKVNLDKVTFESGSKLNLKINSLSDFGGIEANNITVAASGAELSATLAQGINAGTVQLLKANNTDFNNFVDSFDNEMYVFEKADKNGLYNIKLAKTAEEVVEEAGGTTTEARAAAAWVDGNQFDEGTKAAEVANALADLAQNEPKEFTKALSVVAPQEAPKAQSELTELSDKLLLTVGKYLSNQDIGGLSSGDALQDVTIWAKGYYGESKLSNHGKVKGFDSKNKGVIAGFDKKLNKAVKVGAGFQYNDSDVDAYHRDVEVDSLVGFVYGEYRPSKWFVSGVASFGKADYDEEKHALGIKIKDNYSTNVYSLQALTGYDFKYVTPEIGARYYRIKRHGYTDNIGQSVSGKDMDLMRGVFGLRSSYEFGMFKPEVYAGITYDFVSDEDNALVSLPNGSSYTVDGRRLKRFGTEFSANVTAQVTDNTKIGVGYEGKFREHYQDHTGMISVKYEF